MKELPKNVTESVRKRNPHLYAAVGAMETYQPKPAATKALAGRQPTFKRRKGRLAVVVSLTAHVGREFDSDNLQGAFKPTRDAIANSLGIDDGDERIRFEYAQIVTRGSEGIAVKIEIL